MNKVKIFCFVFFACLFTTACNNGAMYSNQVVVDESGWQQDDEVTFNVDITDTNSVYNFLIEVRNNIDYPYSNTFFFLKTTFPDYSFARDTMEFSLCDAAGKWYGRRTGRYVDTRYYFRKNARFPQQGRYQFTFTNGMRDSAIVGIKSVGMRIEQAR